MRRKDKLIYLVSYEHGTDENDDPIQIPIKRSVCAQKKRTWGREFYAAAAFDMRPEHVFVVYEIEYQDEPVIEYQGEEFQLIRTNDSKDPGDIELICSGPGPRPRTR